MKFFKKKENKKVTSKIEFENNKVDFENNKMKISLKKTNSFNLKCFQEGLNEAIAMLEIELFTNDQKSIKKEETFKNFSIQYRFRGLKYFLKIIRKNQNDEILDNLIFRGQNGWSLDIYYGKGIEEGYELNVEKFINTDLERLLDLTNIVKEYVDFWYNNIEQSNEETSKKYDKISLIKKIAEYNDYWGTHISLASQLDIAPYKEI